MPSPDQITLIEQLKSQGKTLVEIAAIVGMEMGDVESVVDMAEVLLATGSGVTQVLAGDGISVSPSGGEGVVTVSATVGGAGQPWIDRAPAGDVTVPDHGSIVVKDYYTPSGTLTLQGDAVLSII